MHATIRIRARQMLNRQAPAGSTRLTFLRNSVLPTPVFKIASTRKRNEDTGLCLPVSQRTATQPAEPSALARRCNSSSLPIHRSCPECCRLAEMKIQENVPLAPFTTFGIGGPARWFVEAASENEIVDALGWARERSLPLFVLGGGSNLLVSDAGFPGFVLRVALKGVDSVEDAGSRLYRAAAGEDWDAFVTRAVQENCAG